MAKQAFKLEPGQWIEEVLFRGRPDGTMGGHVTIGTQFTVAGKTQYAVSDALPVAMLAGQAGFPLADVIGALSLEQQASIEKLDGDLRTERAARGQVERDAAALRDEVKALKASKGITA